MEHPFEESESKYYLKDNNIHKCVVLNDDGKNSIIEYTQVKMNKCDTIPNKKIFSSVENLWVAMSKGEV